MFLFHFMVENLITKQGLFSKALQKSSYKKTENAFGVFMSETVANLASLYLLLLSFVKSHSANWYINKKIFFL